MNRTVLAEPPMQSACFSDILSAPKNNPAELRVKPALGLPTGPIGSTGTVVIEVNGPGGASPRLSHPPLDRSKQPLDQRCDNEFEQSLLVRLRDFAELEAHLARRWLLVHVHVDPSRAGDSVDRTAHTRHAD